MMHIGVAYRTKRNQGHLSPRFAISALAGKREIMRLGGLDHDRPRVFLLSTTHGAETHALAAALETIRVYQTQHVVEFLWKQGERLREGIAEAPVRHGIADQFQVMRRPCNLVYATRDKENKPSQAFRPLFLQELIRGGIVTPSFVVSFSHADADIDRTLDVVDSAVSVYAKALQDGVEKYLVGRPVKPVNRGYN